MIDDYQAWKAKNGGRDSVIDDDLEHSIDTTDVNWDYFLTANGSNVILEVDQVGSDLQKAIKDQIIADFDHELSSDVGQLADSIDPELNPDALSNPLLSAENKFYSAATSDAQNQITLIDNEIAQDEADADALDTL